MVKQFNGNKFDSLGEMDNSLKETKYQSSLINRHNSYLLRKLNVYLKKTCPQRKLQAQMTPLMHTTKHLKKK